MKTSLSGPRSKLTTNGVAMVTVMSILVMAAFVVGLGMVIAGAFTRREARVFELAPLVPVERTVERTQDTVTIDARDETRWTYFDFERRSTVFPPDTASWDIALRRFDLISSAGAYKSPVADFDAVREVPPGDFVMTTWGRDTVNTALDRWYDYSFTSHLLTPQENVYIVRTPEGGSVKFQLLSYYCTGMVPGCVTIHYEYAPPGEPQFLQRDAQAPHG